MQIIQERFEDAGERDAHGYYDYCYSGVIYRFVFPTRMLVARSYDNDLSNASFLGPKSLQNGTTERFKEIPYRDPEFREAVAYLRQSEGVESVRVLLSHGYVEIDFSELAS